MSQSFDIAIRCGWLLTMKPGADEKPLRDHLIGIRGRDIAYVGPEGAIEWTATKTLDATQKIVMPGLVNGHTHLPMSLFRGLADDLPFEEWLHKYILPLEGRLVSPEFVRIGTELAAFESIQRGVTTLCDMYYFEDEIGDVLDKAGLRAIVGETVADFPQPDDKQKQDLNYRILEKMAERWGKGGRIQPAVAPHAPYTCSDDTLRKAATFAQKHEMPILIHVSETKNEIDVSQKEHGMSPVRRLKKLGVMDQPCVFAHCVHVSPEDMSIIKESGAGVVHNPESNMKLGSGIAPVRAMLNAGLRVGIGTDGAASNNDLNLFKEMDTAAKLQKLAHADNTAMTAIQALRMATYEGARALHMEKIIGSLEVGKRADIVIIDTHVVNMQPLHDIPSQLVYATTGTEVETVLCDGKIIMEEWDVLTMSRKDIFTRVERYREKSNF
ncbi:MAG: amidohydrolase [Bdellovibrionales bacterium]|nr:amidohydrolase [Bdellovibrionales bacterium]